MIISNRFIIKTLGSVAAKILLAAILSAAFISCEDDSPAEGGAAGKIGVNIIDSGYEWVTMHKIHAGGSTVEPENDYYKGMKIIFKLDDPSKRDNIERIVMSAENVGEFTFEKQDLADSYSDTLGGYIIEMLTLPDEYKYYYSSVVWSVVLYSKMGGSALPYSFPITGMSYIYPHTCANEWLNTNSLTMTMSGNIIYNGPSSNAIAETHFLDAYSVEKGITTSSISDYKWTAINVPEAAKYFYYIIRDNNNGINREFISDRYSITGRLPGNVEFIDVKNPVQVEYLADLDKIMVLCSGGEMALINYEDNSIVWRKQLSETPSSFEYSSSRNTAYLVYSSGIVDSLNPYDGSVGRLFRAPYGLSQVKSIWNYLILFQTGYIKQLIDYDLRTKKFVSFYSSDLLQGTSAVFNPYNGHIYTADRSSLSVFYFYADVNVIQWHESSYGIGTNCIALQPDGKRIFSGDGSVYNCRTDEGSELTSIGSISLFNHIAFIDENYIAAINQEYGGTNWTVIPSSVTIYNYGLNKLGSVTGLTGKPLKLYNKGNNLKVYSIRDNGMLVAQKFTLGDIINGSSNKTNVQRKIYKIKLCK